MRSNYWFRTIIASLLISSLALSTPTPESKESEKSEQTTSNKKKRIAEILVSLAVIGLGTYVKHTGAINFHLQNPVQPDQEEEEDDDDDDDDVGNSSEHESKDHEYKLITCDADHLAQVRQAARILASEGTSQITRHRNSNRKYYVLVTMPHRTLLIGNRLAMMLSEGVLTIFPSSVALQALRNWQMQLTTPPQPERPLAITHVQSQPRALETYIVQSTQGTWLVEFPPDAWHLETQSSQSLYDLARNEENDDEDRRAAVTMLVLRPTKIAQALLDSLIKSYVLDELRPD